MKASYVTITTELALNDRALRDAVYRGHSGRCFYTGQQISQAEMVIDHIIPVRTGGKNCIENYVPTTNRLNLLKNNKTGDATERMVSINQLVYAPRVLALYTQTSRGPRLTRKDVQEGINRLRTEVDFERFPELKGIADSLERLMDGASEGGKARAKKLTKKRRKEIATNAANARWKTKKVK